MKHFAVFFLALGTSSVHAVAQTATTPAAFCDKDIRPAVIAFCHDLADFQTQVNKNVAEADLSGDFNKLDLSKPQAAVDFITAVAGQMNAKTAMQSAAQGLVGWLNQQRTDQQLGAGASATGTTSLVTKAGSSQLISLAVDSGGLTRSVNGTTATLGTNSDQIFRTVTNHNPNCLLYVNCTSLGWFEDNILNKLSLSAGFSLAQQSTTTAASSGQASGSASSAVSNVAIPSGAGRLANISAKFEVRNKFDPHQQAFQSKWKDLVDANADMKAAIKTIGDNTDLIKATLQKDAPQLDQDALYQAAKSDKSGTVLDNYFNEYFTAALQKVEVDASLPVNVVNVLQNRATYHDLWNTMLDNAAGTLFTVQYTFDQPLNQPKTHDFTVVYGYSFKTMGAVTANGGFSLYDGALPAGAQYGRFHYGQISAEYDQNLSGKTSSLQEQLTLAAYWQYQPQPSVLNIAAGTVAPGTNIPIPNGTQEFVGTAGSLWVAQGKLTIKGAGGIDIPVGVSWSNKTDLLQDSKVGAQVGISYDLSSLSSYFGGSSH
ncbi:MAG TPA: hypothetical protein VMQ60_07525 [Acidobacteriaceae bacterium]|nr:hypothetical protein [Acidobacteriaceae bacterium]